MSIFSRFNFSDPDLGTLKIAQLCSTITNKAKSYLPDVITNNARSAIDFSSAALSAAASGAVQYSKFGKLVSALEFAKDIGFTISHGSSVIDAISNKKTAAKWHLLQTARYASYIAMNYAAVYYVDNNYLTAAAIAAPVASYAMGGVIDGITNWVSSKASPYLPVAPIEVLEKQVENLIKEKKELNPDNDISKINSDLKKLRSENILLKEDKQALSAANQLLIDDLKNHEDTSQAANRKGKAKVSEGPRRDPEINPANLRELERKISQKDAKIKELEDRFGRLTESNENLKKNAAQLRAQLNQLADEEAKRNPDSDLVNKLRRLVKLCEELGPDVMSYYSQHASPSGAAAARSRHR
jgi:hypothetical protein